MVKGWKDDLKLILGKIARIASGASTFRIITAGNRLALALPRNARAALLVANLYQPQRLKGRIFRMIAKWLIHLRIAKRFPSFVPGEAVLPRVAWLREAAAAGSVGFLGCNPNHGLRCVLAGIEPGRGDPFIAKLGFGASAAAVDREHQVLSSIAGRWPGVVATLGLESGEWERPGNEGPPEAEAWSLLRLPHLGEVAPGSMADPRVKSLLASWLGEESVCLGAAPWAAALLDQVPRKAVPTSWHGKMQDLRVRRALLHGDFAVWNLRASGQELVAIDWEWGTEDAVAGVDLAHGLRQEAFMVRGMKPAVAVEWMLREARSERWRDYVADCGWSGMEEDWLRLGLLHSHFNALNPSVELLEVLGVHLNS